MITNQFSFVFFGLGTLIVVLGFMRWRRIDWRSTLIVGVVIALVFTGAFFVLRVGANDVTSVSATQAQIGAGKPALLEFYSDFCVGCMSVRPVVDTLIADMGDRLTVLRVDIHSAVGRELRAIYGFTYSPEFVLFDPTGVEVWRANNPPTSAELQLARVEAISSTTP
jgi:thiol-disulfide isomerase/thioredoxin